LTDSAENIKKYLSAEIDRRKINTLFFEFKMNEKKQSINNKLCKENSGRVTVQIFNPCEYAT